jgi:hypothetical protein
MKIRAEDKDLRIGSVIPIASIQMCNIIVEIDSIESIK